MTFVISMGGIDLSVGSTMQVLQNDPCSHMILNGQNIYLAILVVILVGAVSDLSMVFWSQSFVWHIFIATLGTMSILRGLIYVYTEGIPPYGLKYPEIKVWGRDILE